MIIDKTVKFLLIVYLITQIVIAWPGVLIYLQAWFPIPTIEHTQTSESEHKEHAQYH